MINKAATHSGRGPFIPNRHGGESAPPGGGWTAALTPQQLAIVAPFPIIVWGADETRRWLIRRYHARHQTTLS